jgi:hypothetical protein
MKPHPLIAALTKACRGVLFPSESDAPLEPFTWDGSGEPTSAALTQSAGLDRKTPTQTTDLASLFRAVPKAKKAKFDAIAKLLSEHVSDIRVVKIGEVNVTVFVLGKTKDGMWMGLKTEVVET